MKITVIGVGYVGLVTAVCLAQKGHFVNCVDIDEEKINKLKKGQCILHENDLDTLLQENFDNLFFTTDFSRTCKNIDAIFICVGTPERKDGSANLTYVFQVAEQIAFNIIHDCIVILKSTVPIGTNNRLDKFFHKKLIGKKVNIEVVANPEFLAQGTAVRDTLYASRIIFGTENDSAKKIMENIYKDFDCPKLFVSHNSAEMIKYASNDFLALKISYINEIANLCEKLGADIEEVTSGMGLDTRIGNQFLKAGIGYGGSCFPKDTKALHWLSNFHDHELKTIKAAIEVNEKQKILLLKKAHKYFESFSGLTVAVLGLTFKPGTDDLREAPSLDNIPILLDDSARIKAYDPIANNIFKKIFPKKIQCCDNIDETLKGTDICFIFTEWEQIKQYPLENFAKLMKTPIILDGRNCYSHDIMSKTKGIIYESIGRKTINTI